MSFSPLHRRLLAVFLIISSLLVSILLFLSRPQQPPLEIGERSWRVATQTVELSSLAPIISLYGRLESPRLAHLRATLEADVIYVHVREGENVAAGATLIELDSREVDLQVQMRQAELEEIQALIAQERKRFASDAKNLEYENNLLALAKRSWQRQQDLQRNDLTSQAAREEAERLYQQQALAVQARRLSVESSDLHLAQLTARAKRAQAWLDTSRLELERTRIQAPFAGRITQVAVAPGNRVRNGDSLLHLFDTHALEVRAPIPTDYIAILREALTAGKALEATALVDGLSLRLQLTRFAGQTGTSGGTIEGLFNSLESTSDVTLGRFVELRLSLPTQDNVLALPFEAVYGRNIIYRLHAERMRALEVERLGEWTLFDEQGRGESYILVRHTDLQPGDQIIITRLPNAMDGLRVTPVAAPAQPLSES